MKLVDYLRALLSRFYSKKDSADIVALRNINESAVQIVNQSETNNPEAIRFVAPANGRLTSVIDNHTFFNGFQTFGYFAQLINAYSPAKFANSAVSIDVKKGEEVLIHRNTEQGVRKILIFFPFMGGEVNSILNPLLSIQGGLLCLRNTCKLYLKPLLVVRKSGSANNLLQPLDLILTSTKHRLSHQQRGHSLACSSIIALSLGTSIRETKAEVSFLDVLPNLPILVLSKLKFARVRQFIAIPKVGPLKCFSLTTKAKSHNLSFGGALC